MEIQQERLEQWLKQPNLEEALKKELQSIQTNKDEVEDRFYKDLEFGTGGLRGVLGAGNNRMNIYTVSRVTRGFAAYLNKKYKNPCVAIAYDSRINSDVFSQITAAEFAKAGIKVYIYSELMPTPMLSFAVRHLKCKGGVMVTASHNPAKYNGYKAYGEDGCQVSLDAADEIAACIDKQPLFEDTLPSYQTYLQNNMISVIQQDTLDAYYAEVLKESICKPQTPIKVAFSPLNGTGNKPVRHILKAIGNVEVTVVAEQELPDGNFPTAPYPNPEIEEAMQLLMLLGENINADICIATDPDCDRVGTAIPTRNGATLISGNEMGVLLLDYICKNKIAQKNMPRNPITVKTIVTTPMIDKVALKYGVDVRNVLTGFKFIGEQIGMLEQQNKAQDYIFGFEESYGYLSGTYVRDKDAVNASMLICEMVSSYKKDNKTLLDVLNSLYKEHGYYQNLLLTFAFEGPTGMQQMNQFLNDMRQEHPAQFDKRNVLTSIDYLNDDTGLPKSNVLSLQLEGDAQVLMRPSGTEPKLKMYISTCGVNMDDALAQAQSLAAACRTFIGK